MAYVQNGLIFWYPRYGNSSSAVTSYRNLFLLGQSTRNLDPQLYFDAAHSRWVAAEVSIDCFEGEPPAAYGHGYLDFAISDGPDPTKGWQVYYYTYSDYAPTAIGLGNSRDAFILTTSVQRMTNDNCDLEENNGNEVFSFDWTEYITQPGFAPSYWQYAPGPDWYRILSPAIQFPATDPEAHIVAVAKRANDGPNEIVHMTVNAGTGLIHSEFLTDAGALRDMHAPPLIPQGNSSDIYVRPFGATSVVWQADRLVFGSNDGCVPDGDTVLRACARITELDTGVVPATVRQDFLIARASGHVYAPGVALSQLGELHLAFTQSSSTLKPSAYVSRQRPGDAAASISQPKRIAGALDWNLGDWADYVQPSADPLVRDSVWVTALAGGGVNLGVQLTTFGGATYNPLSPVRILDTRVGKGLTGVFAANVPRTFNVAGANGVPPDAVAITGNVTVAGQTAAGYLSVGPTKTTTPTSSTINFPLGDARANNVTLPLDASGDLSAVYKAGAGKTTQLILDVTGYFLADDSGSTYQPVTAKRVLDTRFGTGLSGKFLANTPRTFQVTGGTIPWAAVAVTGNLTVVGQSKAGYVSLTPTPTATPATSTINFPLGDTRANGVTVPLSGTGTLSAVFKASGGSTDLIFDVTGYYLDGTSGLRFYPLNPGRIMDTRFNTLTQLFGPFSSSVPRTLVTGGHFGVPVNGLAVTGNLTVVGQTKAGYVSITKDPIVNPTVSNLNFPYGDIRANGVTVPLNASNDMAIVYKASSGAKTHLILDLTGYFR